MSDVYEDNINSNANNYANDERMNPREFIPVLSTEFNQICQLVIDGDTLERQITEQFLLMTQGFELCETAYLQTLYSQVEQQLCTKAILDTLTQYNPGPMGLDIMSRVYGPI